MRKLVLIVMLVFVVSGCSGVIMNREYSQMLDRQVAWADEVARRANMDPNAGGLTELEKNLALTISRDQWRRFRDARDGKESE